MLVVQVMGSVLLVTVVVTVDEMPGKVMSVEDVRE
jgi:hypothetical protein